MQNTVAKTAYRKLTGRRSAAFGYSQLWLAPDHLLLVKSTRFAEQYQRFALADIQSITVTKLRGRAPLQGAGMVAAIVWMAAAFRFDSPFLKYFFVVTGIAALAMLLAEMLRGPRCRCYLTTAVTRELLTPVSRVGVAESFLAAVRPAIESVQGTLGVAELVNLGSADAPRPPEIAAHAGYLPEAAFALLLLDAALIALALRFPRLQTGAALPTTFLAEIILLTVALFRRGHDPRRVTFIVMLFALAGIGSDIVGAGRNLTAWGEFLIQTGPQGDPMAFVNRVSWEHSAILAAIWRTAAGAAGLAAAFFERTSS